MTSLGIIFFTVLHFGLFRSFINLIVIKSLHTAEDIKHNKIKHTLVEIWIDLKQKLAPDVGPSTGLPGIKYLTYQSLAVMQIKSPQSKVHKFRVKPNVFKRRRRTCSTGLFKISWQFTHHINARYVITEQT